MKEVTLKVWDNVVLFIKDDVYNDALAFQDFMDEYLADSDMESARYEILMVKES